MRIALVLMMLLICSCMGFAQDPEDVTDWESTSVDETIACLNAADERPARWPFCRGIIFEACPENAGSTQGMVNCQTVEFRFWEQRMTLAYNELLEAYRDGDTDAFEYSPYKLAPMLREAQKAWIEYRDRHCEVFERFRYRGGSMGRLTAASCLNDMTAQRAQELAMLLEEGAL